MQVNDSEFYNDIIDTGVLMAGSHNVPERSLNILGKTTYELGSMCHWQSEGSVGYVLNGRSLGPFPVIQEVTKYPSMTFGEIIHIKNNSNE